MDRIKEPLRTFHIIEGSCYRKDALPLSGSKVKSGKLAYLTDCKIQLSNKVKFGPLLNFSDETGTQNANS